MESSYVMIKRPKSIQGPGEGELKCRPTNLEIGVLESK